MSAIIPFPDALSFINTLLEYKKKSETETVLKMMEQGNLTLPDALAANPYYIASLKRTLDAIDRASCSEKIEILKELYISGEKSGVISTSPDLYQEMLTILSDLSLREILILRNLELGGLRYSNDKIVKQPNEAHADGLPSAADLYFSARKFCAERLQLDEDNLTALIVRLLRTGLLTSTPTWESSIYFFSPLYRDLRQLITHGFYE
jgi:hypothetical protein